MIVRHAGPLMTVQDLGRPGHRSEGITCGGALDLHAARVLNLLVGNSENAALFEATSGHLQLEFTDERVIAFCGAEVNARVRGEKIFAGHSVRVRSGEELTLEFGNRGLRLWLAIGGGVDVPKILRSRATDLRAHFGGFEGRSLRDGDELSLGKSNRFQKFEARMTSWRAPNEWISPAVAHPVLRVTAGAEWDDFTNEARVCFSHELFSVTPQIDRMGARLHGAELRRVSGRELISEAVAPGTIQVAHDHQPILLLGDCQTVGGYPKIAHVITVDLPIAAQLQPGDRVRFQLVEIAEAIALYRRREVEFSRFRVGLSFLQ